MEKNAFGYAKTIKDEIGIYIVCDDSNLLITVNQILRKSGMVAISDTAGRQHFLIDARKNRCLATQYIKKLLLPSSDSAAVMSENRDQLLENTVNSILDSHGFDKTLIGTTLLSSLLRHIYYVGVELHYKKIYADIGKIYTMSSGQVERNIRYALQKSNMWYVGLKNAKACLMLLEEVRERFDKMS
ncbi:MAG: hypothetical protein K6F83_05355 [Clostridiales bacterium]|nr:hypothetical protein [Clostridiales bacterium]